MRQYNCIAKVMSISDKHIIVKTHDYLDVKKYSDGIRFFHHTAVIRAQLPSISTVFTQDLLQYCVEHGRASLKYQEIKFVFHLQPFSFYNKTTKKYVYGNKVVIDQMDRTALME